MRPRPQLVSALPRRLLHCGLLLGAGLLHRLHLAGQLGTELHYRAEQEQVVFSFFLELA